MSGVRCPVDRCRKLVLTHDAGAKGDLASLLPSGDAREGLPPRVELTTGARHVALRAFVCPRGHLVALGRDGSLHVVSHEASDDDMQVWNGNRPH